ncbi:MAG: A24 family peptidase [Planctomycetota bacterium]|jgi:prepilin peptidase CpaA
MTGTVVFVTAVGLYTAAAAAVDMRTRRIPNYLTVPAALTGLLYHSFASSGMGPWASLGGFALGFGLLLIPWLLGGGGMGDVKMLAALGAWLGPKRMLIAFAASAVVGTALAAGTFLTGASKTGGAKRRGSARSGKRSSARQKTKALPYAVPLAISTWAMLAWMITSGKL